MDNLNLKFNASKADINNTWNCSDSCDRISRDWILGVDPETMIFAKALFSLMPGSYSLYSTFVAIMKGKDLASVLAK